MIGASAGNHAGALAYASALEGIDCLVVMWQGASELKRAATLGYGASVDQEALGPTEVFERLHALQEETGRVLVHPFDDPLIVGGAGTVGLEIGQDRPEVEIVVNGKPLSVFAGATVHDFLAGKRMTDAMAIVERNGEIVPRGEYGDTPLQAGDRLEVVHAVGGG